MSRANEYIPGKTEKIAILKACGPRDRMINMRSNASDYLDLTDEKLKAFAAKLAGDNPKGRLAGDRSELRKLKKTLLAIGKTYKRTLAFIEKETLIPQEMEWITDNYYIAQSIGDDAAQSIRSFKRIPSLKSEWRKIYVGFLSENFLRATGYIVTEDRIASFLSGVCEANELSEEELSAFLSFLKAGVLYLIKDVCEVIERILDGYIGKAGGCFSDEIKIHHTRDSGSVPSEKETAGKKEAQKLHEELSDLLRRSFSSLRFMIDYDSNTLIREQNPVEQILSKDPSGDYPNMSEKSRAYYRYQPFKAFKKGKAFGARIGGACSFAVGSGKK